MDAISAIRTSFPEIARPQDRNVGQAEGGSFIETLEGAMRQSDGLRTDAQQQIAAVLNGSGGELHGAAIAVEKADVAFQLMLQVRNKMVAAYQEVAHMQF